MESAEMNSKPKRSFSRRDFLKVLGIAGLEAALLAWGGTYVFQVEPESVEVTQVRLALPRLPKAFSGLRMAQISDIHLGSWMTIARFEHLLEVIAQQAPHLVAFTGDFVLAYSNMNSIQGLLDASTVGLSWLTAQFPTVGVLGNHDYWYDAPAVQKSLERSGVRVLVNSVEKFQFGAESIYFAGVDDVMQGEARLPLVLNALPVEGCAILLAHEPDFAEVSAESGRFDLQISGHSHGGQVNLPFIGPPVLPYLARKYPNGLYKVGNMLQYTNRGVGMTPPFVRLNCRPEITVFTLESA